MLGFHVDMNVAQFTRPYLEKWLRELARIGYDTILWEVENNIRWESCPECVSPDAFSKEEFGQILALCRSLGLEPIPLFQTIAHCEYVLKHEGYQHLAEMPGEISQYCPRNADLMPFLHAWIEEYLEVFGDVNYFHVGADEAWWMGRCDSCRAYVERHSLGRLYVEHVNAVSEPLRRRGITPAIWADMVLHHHQALDLLSRDIMLFDWVYSVHRGDGYVQVWGTGRRHQDDIPPEALRRFGPFLYPEGDEPGRDAETFYTADFLAAEGFRVVGCPSSSSYGGNVFAPRSRFHTANTFDWFRKCAAEHLEGGVLTSWSVHLHPWELQLACIDIAPYVASNPTGGIEDFEETFAKERFGLAGGDFFRACGLLSKTSLLTHTASVGHDKSTRPVPPDRVKTLLSEMEENGRLEEELQNSRERLQEYCQALELFRACAAAADKGGEYLAVWELAARNLINRAQAACFLMERAEHVIRGRPLPDAEAADGTRILADLRALREETATLYEPIIKPTRRAEYLAWMFDSVEQTLATLVGD